MTLLSSKNDNSSLCYESSLLIKILKIDKFGDFSCDIDYNSRTDVFRDAISLIINQCDPRRPKGASGGHKVSASRAAQASEARLLSKKSNRTFIIIVNSTNPISDILVTSNTLYSFAQR